jgi:hypothetical protein
LRNAIIGGVPDQHHPTRRHVARGYRNGIEIEAGGLRKRLAFAQQPSAIPEGSRWPLFRARLFFGSAPSSIFTPAMRLFSLSAHLVALAGDLVDFVVSNPLPTAL